MQAAYDWVKKEGQKMSRLPLLGCVAMKTEMSFGKLVNNNYKITKMKTKLTSE